LRQRLARVRRGSAFEVAFIAAVALGLALSVQAYAVKPFRIPSESMQPTLRVGDRVLVDRFSRRLLGTQPGIGDIVVFHPPAGADASPPQCGSPSQGAGSPTPCSRSTATASDQTFIKRVVALAGDRIAIRDGHVIRNGKLQAESFSAPCGADPACDFSRPIEIPKGTVFLMGDNRGASQDSRFWGPIPIPWIIGTAIAIYWPPKHLGTP
jgi:signal peptidase I